MQRNLRARNLRPAVHVGTSGWSYEHWKGPFYPSDVRTSDMLARYAESFRTTEINSSFYRLPALATLDSWRRTTPPGFVFAAKASRFITHMKKLKDPKQTLRPFLSRIRKLAEKLGPLLFQLPPNWSYNETRLAAFLDALPRDLRYAFEFRDRSWLNDHTFELLAAHDAALCVYELEGFRSPSIATTDLVYVRLHGPDAVYRGSYDDRSLERWADQLTTWSGEGRTAYCYFDNDESAHAASDALRLRAMMSQSR